jgi:type II secretory pathway pseudopilin PulG
VLGIAGALAVVVVILGILAAIAIPSFIRYTRRAEATEATLSLSRIAFGATSYYESRAPDVREAFPPSTDWTPAVPPCEGGSPLYQPRDDDWSHATWRALGFVMATAHRYRYRFTRAAGANPGFVVEAEGDLNCNGVRAHYVRRGRLVDGKVVVGPVESERPLD